MTEKFYLSIFAQFESDEARRAWMMDHVIKHCRPHNGPIFSWSSDDESAFRDQNADLLEAIEKAEQQLDYGQDKKAHEILIAALAKAKGETP